jgi:hypothetical protein
MINYSLSVYQTSSLHELTCWQKKSGAELFPDVPARTLTICGAKRTEDEWLELAVEESLKSYETEKKLFIDLTKAKCPDPHCLNPK